SERKPHVEPVRHPTHLFSACSTAVLKVGAYPFTIYTLVPAARNAASPSLVRYPGSCTFPSSLNLTLAYSGPRSLACMHSLSSAPFFLTLPKFPFFVNPSAECGVHRGQVFL